MPVVQVGTLVVSLDSSSPSLLGLPAWAFCLSLGCLPILPPPRLVLVVRMVLFVLHSEPFGLLNEGALITLVQQPGGGGHQSQYECWSDQASFPLSYVPGMDTQRAGPMQGCALWLAPRRCQTKEPQPGMVVVPISVLSKAGGHQGLAPKHVV